MQLTIGNSDVPSATSAAKLWLGCGFAVSPTRSLVGGDISSRPREARRREHHFLFSLADPIFGLYTKSPPTLFVRCTPRNVAKPSVLPVEDDSAGVSETSSAGAAVAGAAAAAPRARHHSFPPRAGQESVGSSGAQASPNRRRFAANPGNGPRAASSGGDDGAAAGCGAMDVDTTTEGKERRACGAMLPPSTPHVLCSSSPAKMIQQRIGKKEAPGFDAAVAVPTAAAGEANEGKGGAAAAAEGCVDPEDEDHNSSDGGAAYEDLSAWLHSTDDWWIS